MVQFDGKELTSGITDPATMFIVFAAIIGIAAVAFIGWTIYQYFT